MMITLLLLLYPLVTAYNLQLDNAIIYKPPQLSNQTSGFGYSVLLSSRTQLLPNGSVIHEPWIFVGAPNANYTTKPGHGNNKIPREPGVTYRCKLPNLCVPINVRNPDNENGFIEQIQLHMQIEKEHGWLGAAMSLSRPTNSLIGYSNGFSMFFEEKQIVSFFLNTNVDNAIIKFPEPTNYLIVCAPRTIVRLYSSPAIYAETMQGVCYKGELYSDDLHIEDKNFTTYNFSSKFWYSPLNGFSVHYPKSKENIPSDTIEPIIGSPKHELFGSVQKIGQNKIAELPIGHSLAQFGYALTSGYYFNKAQLMMAAGAPGFQYVGQVAILESRLDSLIAIVTIKGKEIGEYFGASLATGDINNDGLDDLIVGAPHWKNDNGRVHIFLGNKDGFLQGHILVLEGNMDDALFGYAVTSGDLDGDGFYDIIVGAPWEDSGVIYVYNGAAKLAELELLKPSQRIAASEIRTNMLRFGFSLSNLVDINGDGTSDVAVGAYASEHVVILRSKPAVKIRFTLSTDPQILLRNSTGFKLNVCFDDSYPNVIDGIYKLESVIDFTIDKDYERVKKRSSTETLSFFRNPPKCKYMDIELQGNINNRMDPIKIVGSHRFRYYLPFDNCANTSETYMGSLCPTEYKARKVTTETEISFDIGCGMDDICHASIFTKQYFQNTRDSTWIIGSDYLSLVVEIGNFGEAAYLTTVKFHIPTGVNLKSIPTSCQEEEDAGTLEVVCDVGNPLEKTMKSIILDFDMKEINNGSANGTTLIFSADIKTRSENKGVKNITIPLHLKANVSISLNGIAYDNSYYFENNERPTNFTFLHTYQISRFGVTPISEAFLIIDIPYKVDGLEFLSLLHEPRISVSGQFYGCQVTGVSVTKLHFLDELSFKAKYEISHMIPTNSTQWQSDRNTQSLFNNIVNSENVNITYLNCSANNVICGQVVCKILPLNTAWEVGKLDLQLAVIDLGLNGGTDLKEKVIHITTKAFVTVVDPDMEFTIPGAGIIVPVTTTVLYSPNHRTSKISGINIWTIVGSVTLGLLILCLLAIGLWKFDFFKRSKKEELETLKRREDIEPTELICEEVDDVSI